jgi:hypothetical protein
MEDKMFTKKNIVEVTHLNDDELFNACEYSLNLCSIVKSLRSLPKDSCGRTSKKAIELLKSWGYERDFCHTKISAGKIKIDFDSRKILYGSYNIAGAYRAYIKSF